MLDELRNGVISHLSQNRKCVIATPEVHAAWAILDHYVTSELELNGRLAPKTKRYYSDNFDAYPLKACQRFGAKHRGKAFADKSLLLPKRRYTPAVQSGVYRTLITSRKWLTAVAENHASPGLVTKMIGAYMTGAKLAEPRCWRTILKRRLWLPEMELS